MEIGSFDDSLAVEFHWRIATARCMDTMAVVEIPELFKLSLQVTGIPENHVV